MKLARGFVVIKAAALALTGALTTIAHADSIQIDFGSPADSDPTWNYVPTPAFTINGLKNSAGVATGVNFVSTGFWESYGANLTNTATNATSGVLPLFVERDGIAVKDSTSSIVGGPQWIEITLSGLNPALLYDVSVFGGYNGTNTFLTPLKTTVTGSAGSTTQTDPAFFNDWQPVVFSSVAPTAGGELVIKVTSTSGHPYNSYLTALTLDYVPEPASLGMMSLAALTLLRRRH